MLSVVFVLQGIHSKFVLGAFGSRYYETTAAEFVENLFSSQKSNQALRSREGLIRLV